MLYTSYFGNIKKIQTEYPNMWFCSISGKIPEWFLDGQQRYFVCRELAPKYSWWKYWKEKFEDDTESEASKEYYNRKYKDTVLRMVRHYYIRDYMYEHSDGNDVCMLCYETPDKFCHRHIVSEWLNENKVPCIEFPRIITP